MSASLVFEIKFAELLCTRLCHDLTGPIGAVANGAEFLSDEGFDLQGQAIELISSSAAQAVSRLQFYRRAYGRINDDGEADLAEQKKIASDFFAGSKITLDWPDLHTAASGVSVSYKMGRLLLNLIIIMQASLLRGGTLAIRISSSDTMRELRITAAGTAVKWDKEIDETLKGAVAPEALTPKTVQAELTRRLARELNATVSWNVSESMLECVVCQPIIQESAQIA
jgi:histidine phosphotransferase ChpT